MKFNQLILVLLFAFNLFAADGFDRAKIDSLKNLVNQKDSSNTNGSSDLQFNASDYQQQIDSSMLDSSMLDNSSMLDSTIKKKKVLLDDGILYNQYLDYGERDKYYQKVEVDSTALVRFGEEFINQVKNSFPKYGPVNPDYRIGLGDEIIISIWGDVQSNEKLLVNRIGKINPIGIGSITVAGRSIKDLKKTLIAKYSKIYSGVKNGRRNATTFVDVSLGSLRTKQVFVVGNVANPGTYSVPSTAGVLGAIAYAGGIDSNGTYRSILIKRGNKTVSTVDLYDYLVTGNINDSVALADFDVIVVQPIEKTVAINGAVNNPAIYELKNNENFSDLLKYCGGYKPEAFLKSFNVTRTLPHNERVTLSVFDSDTLHLLKNDSLVVPFIDNVTTTVKIEGAVKRPGKYGLYDGMTLIDLINIAGGTTEDYFKDRAEVVRTYDDFNKEIIAVKLGDLLNGDSTENVTLRKWDIVKIYSKWDIQYRHYVSIYGEVKKPGKYFLRDSMTVQDLILLAGGFTEKAFKDTVELSRVTSTDKSAGNITKAIPVKAGEDFYKSGGNYLQHMDNVFVRENTAMKEQQVVYLKGEFKYPGFYAKQSDDETLLSLIERAGGLKQSAYLEGARFYRAKDSIGIVALDIKRLIENHDENEDIILEDGDTLVVPTVPKTVLVDGAVNYPTAVKYERGESVGYYIKKAGGLASNADKRSIYVILANGGVSKVKKHSRDITAGSAIVISEEPENKEKFNWAAFATTLLALASSTLSIILAINQLK